MTNPHYQFRQLFELSAYTGCNSCAEICPAAVTGADGKLSTPYRIAMLNHLLKRRTGILSKLLGRTKLSEGQLINFS